MKQGPFNFAHYEESLRDPNQTLIWILLHALGLQEDQVHALARGQLLHWHQGGRLPSQRVSLVQGQGG